MFRSNASYIIACYIGVLLTCLLITGCCYNWRHEKNWGQQYGEFTILSGLTVTNLENTRPAKIYRLVSAWYWVVMYSITLVTMAIIANVNPDTETEWTELPIVQSIRIIVFLTNRCCQFYSPDWV